MFRDIQTIQLTIENYENQGKFDLHQVIECKRIFVMHSTTLDEQWCENHQRTETMGFPW